MDQNTKSRTIGTSSSVFLFLRIMFICLSLTVGLSILVTTIIDNDMSNDTDRDLESQHEKAEIQIATQFNNIMGDALSVKGITLSTLNYYPDANNNRDLHIENMFQNIIDVTGKYAAITYITVTGDHYTAGDPKTTEVSQFMLDLYNVRSTSTEVRPMLAYVSRFTYSAEVKATTFTVTIPVYDRNDDLVGFVMLEPYMGVIISNIKESLSDTSLMFDLMSVEGSNAYFIYSDLHPERGSSYDPVHFHYGQVIDNAIADNDSGNFSSVDGVTFYNTFGIPVSNYYGQRHEFKAPGNYVISLSISEQQYTERASLAPTLLFVLHGSMLALGIFITILTYINATRRRRLEAKTTRMAQIDTLTGLLNRAYFTENFELTIENNPESKYAILFMDLDGFKSINDSYGHDMGDKVLHIVANRLVMVARRDDLVARFGGDEFAMLVSYNSIDQVKYVANKIVKAIGEVMIIDDSEYQVGVSLGVAIYPDHARTVDDLYKISDNAMYKVKYSTKNAYHISTGEDNK